MLDIYTGVEICSKCGNEIEAIALKETQDVKHLISAVFDKEHFIEKISYIEPLLLQALQGEFPNFKLVYSHTAKSKYYGNTCRYCGTLYGNYYLFDEPDGAFFGDASEYTPNYSVEYVNGSFSIVEYEQQTELDIEDSKHVDLPNRQPTNLFDFE
jgi:hypothetical protein